MNAANGTTELSKPEGWQDNAIPMTAGVVGHTSVQFTGRAPLGIFPTTVEIPLYTVLEIAAAFLVNNVQALKLHDARAKVVGG